MSGKKNKEKKKEKYIREGIVRSIVRLNYFFESKTRDLAGL